MEPPPPPPPHPVERRGRKRRGPAEDQPCPWDQVKDSSDSPEEHDSSTAPDPVAAQAFLDELIEMYLLGKTMTARALTTICHYAHEGGIKEAKRYAVDPSKKGGNFQRKLDVALKLERFDKRLYELEAPGHDRNEPDITTITFHLTPPHEAIAAELAAHPEVINEFHDK
eukprot:3493835-Pyramimonas_sp.AAC.1